RGGIFIESAYQAGRLQERYETLQRIRTKNFRISRGERRMIYEQLGAQIGKLVDAKQKQYGDSFNRAGMVIKVLYPDGIKPEQYDDMLAIVRVIDKLFRIANGNQGEENAYKDIAGYGLLGAKRSG